MKWHIASARRQYKFARRKLFWNINAKNAEDTLFFIPTSEERNISWSLCLSKNCADGNPRNCCDGAKQPKYMKGYFVWVFQKYFHERCLEITAVQSSSFIREKLNVKFLKHKDFPKFLNVWTLLSSPKKHIPMYQSRMKANLQTSQNRFEIFNGFES